MSGTDKCPACGTAYVDHLGLIGTCYRLQEAISGVDVLEKRLAEISTGWIVAQEKIRVLREALESIANCNYKNATDFQEWAKEALRKAGGGNDR